MPKTVGLSQTSLKMLEFLPFHEDLNRAGCLYHQAMGFFTVFKNIFGNGHQVVLEKHAVSIDNLSPCIVNYHFAVELMLKSLISRKNNKTDLQIKSFRHNLVTLVKKAANDYEKLLKITNNSEYMLLLETLSENFNKIRYLEGTICLRHNNKEGWEQKKPLQEFSESLYDIFNTLIEVSEDAKNQILNSVTH